MRKARLARVLVTLLVLSPCLPCQTTDRMKAILGIEDATTAGDLNTASRLLDAALKKYPGDGGLLNLRGIVHARRDELPEARSDFAAAVRATPALTPGWQNLGRACQLLADKDASAVTCAIDSWKRVSVLKPGDVEACASLGLLYERQGEFSKSLIELQKLPPEAASQTPNLLLQCADLAALGRTADAEKIAGQLSARDDFSEGDLEDVRNAFDLPAAAPVAVTLLEALDSRQAAGPAGLQTAGDCL